MDIQNPYAVPAIISTFLYLAFIFLILKIDFNSRLNRISALFFALLLFWSFAEWMERWANSPESALFWARAIMVAIILMPPVLIHLTLVFPWTKKEVSPAIFGLYGSSLLLLSVHLNSDMFVAGVDRYFAGYGTVLGPYGTQIYLYLAFFTIVSILILMRSYVLTNCRIALGQLRMLIIALSISFLFIFFTGFAPHIYGDPKAYPLTTPAFIITGLILLYAISRYHVFVPESKKESASEGAKAEKGIKVLPRERAMDEFYRHVSSGNRVICFTARDSEETKEELDVKHVPVIEIEEACSKKTERKSLIPFMITDALMEKNTAILLDGAENIFSNGELREFLDEMRDLELKENLLIVSLSKNPSGIFDFDLKGNGKSEIQ